MFLFALIAVYIMVLDIFKLNSKLWDLFGSGAASLLEKLDFK